MPVYIVLRERNKGYGFFWLGSAVGRKNVCNILYQNIFSIINRKQIKAQIIKIKYYIKTWIVTEWSNVVFEVGVVVTQDLN